jgi:hypothetical protein
MATTIQLKRGTGSAVPASLADGEFAINLDSGKLFYGSGSGAQSNFAFGEITASGNISSSGNIYAADYFDNGTNISSIYSPIAGGSGITTVGTLGSLTVTGNITANGNIVGDDGTDITNIGEVQCDAIASDAGSTTRIQMGAATIDVLVDDTDVFNVSPILFTHNIPVKFSSHITASGNISSSGDIIGSNLIANSASFSTRVTLNDAKVTNVSTNLTATTHASQITINSSDGDNVVIAEASDTIAGLMTTTHHDKLDGIEANATADQTQADINGLAITTVGTIGTGVWNGTVITSAKLDADTAHLSGAQSFTGLKTFTAGIAPSYIKHTISGNNAGDYGPGAEILFGISSETTTAGAIYTLRSGVWTLIDANTDNRVDRLCAVAVGTDSSTDGMLIRGCVTLASVFTAGTDIEGVQVYASETAGQATITAPSDSTDLVRILGYSLNVSAKKMFFNPDSTFLEIA